MSRFPKMPQREQSHCRLRRLGRVLVALPVLAFIVWGAFALHFQVAQPAVLFLALMVWITTGGALVVAILCGSHTRGCGAAFGLAAIFMLAWWFTIKPSHHRDWADDVAHMLESDIDGNNVTLRNVRNFEWRSETDYTPRWITRKYRLDQLESADLVLSYWMGPHIAHTLVSFGFSDGQRLVFSLEIRKERHESFSAVGGFFRKFEQVIIAAEERDIIRTRSNARGEDVFLYNLRIPPPELRTLFLAYLKEAEVLRQEPTFYNTLTSNCTTVIYDLAKQIAPGLPLDYRLLLSGHFAEYAYDRNALVQGYEYQRLQTLGHINARAQKADATGINFSQAIREGVPQAVRDSDHD